MKLLDDLCLQIVRKSATLPPRMLIISLVFAHVIDCWDNVSTRDSSFQRRQHNRQDFGDNKKLILADNRNGFKEYLRRIFIISVEYRRNSKHNN